MRRVAVFLLAVLMLTACAKQAPEVEPQAQVPADQRTEATATEGATDGGGGGGEGARFVAIDIDFESAPETIPAGETEMTLVNNGASLHDVSFDETGETYVVAQGGETASETVTLEAGTYTYFCSVPGHREAGMEGELTVE